MVHRSTEKMSYKFYCMLLENTNAVYQFTYFFKFCLMLFFVAAIQTLVFGDSNRKVLMRGNEK